jgi:protein-S-isoprenylcysteine O-methyltransferase Ste14
MSNNKPASLLSHLAAILLLPVNVIVIVPFALLYFFGYRFGWGADMPFSLLFISVGTLLMLAGLFLLTATIKQFAAQGKGTLAPWDPPKELVIDGPYRYSRNPMISGVSITLFGEVIVFGSIPLLLWFLYFTITNYIYIAKKEEPLLEEKFGKDYLEYKRNVPRVIPRRKPWVPD